MKPVTTIGYLLQHVASALQRQSDQVLQERLGIGMSQYRILMMLQALPETNQRKLADCLGQTEASISRQIKLMIDKGLLQTSVNPENRREHLTTPTAKGLRLTEESMKVMQGYHAEMFKHLGDKKQQQLIESLAGMHQDVCQLGRVGACNHTFSN